MSLLPSPRGPLSEALIAALAGAPGTLPPITVMAPSDPLADDDLHLALYVLYELHYRGFDGVDERWEWDPSLLALRARLEGVFEAGLADAPARAGPPPAGAPPKDPARRRVAGDDDAPALSRP